jgi:hypothetical protein
MKKSFTWKRHSQYKRSKINDSVERKDSDKSKKKAARFDCFGINHNFTVSPICKGEIRYPSSAKAPSLLLNK